YSCRAKSVLEKGAGNRTLTRPCLLAGRVAAAGQTADHLPDRGPAHHLLGHLGLALVVACQPPVGGQPGQGPPRPTGARSPRTRPGRGPCGRCTASWTAPLLSRPPEPRQTLRRRTRTAPAWPGTGSTAWSWPRHAPGRRRPSRTRRSAAPGCRLL